MGCGLIIFALIAVLVAIFPAWKTLMSGDELAYMYPNFLLFFPDEDSRVLVKKTWAQEKYQKVDTSIVYEPSQIPSIDARDYSFESLRKATQNFHRPAVVRGLFKGTVALEKWHENGYLAEKLGSSKIDVIHQAKYGTNQRNKSQVPANEAITEVITNEESMDYLFFPALSRTDSVNNAIIDDVSRVVQEDLELDRIFSGFGSKSHKSYVGSQMIIGRGKEVDSEETTGTGWHCAIANNYFVQTVGRKRWYFLDPPHSSYMKTLRGGHVHMMVGDPNIGNLHKHLPMRYCDLEPGDLLFNPPWEWHTIKNYPGLSIGVPIRESDYALSFSNNFQFSSIVAINMILKRLGVHIPTY